jgi:hypothetical protein
MSDTLQEIRDELAFREAVVLQALPALLSPTDVNTLTQESSELSRRLSIALFNLSSDLATERRLRRQASLGQSQIPQSPATRPGEAYATSRRTA